MSKRAKKFLNSSNTTTAAIWALNAACEVLCEKVDQDWSHEFAGIGMPVEIDCGDGWNTENLSAGYQVIMLEGALASGHDYKFVFSMTKSAESFVPDGVILEVDSLDDKNDSPRLLRLIGTAQFDKIIPGKIVVNLDHIEVVDDQP